MIQVLVVPFYVLKKNEVPVGSITPGILAKTAFNQDKTFVLFAEEHQLTQDMLVVIANAATTMIKVITHDDRLTKGLRNKNIEVFDSLKSAEESPFELAALIISAQDRDKLFHYLNAKKPNLLVPMRSIISNYHKLKPSNQAVIKQVANNFWKIDPQIIHSILCFKIDPQDLYLKWNYPKKKDKKEKVK